MTVAPPGAPETVAVNGLALRVVRCGNGPPLVLVNGIGAAVEMWAPLFAQVSRHELIAFDLPGSGRSPHGRRPLRMPQLAQLVLSLLDELGYGQVDALGYSFGGAVAQELARAAPDRVERLVLCATTPGVLSVPPHPLVASLMLTPARYYDRRLARVMVPIIAGGFTRRDPRALHAHLDERLANPPSTVGYAHQLYALTAWSSLRWLARIRQPTLILHGDDDPLVPLANARLMARLLPDAQLRVVPRGGHLFLVDEPASIIGTLEAFLSRPPASASTSSRHGGGLLR